MRKPVMTSRMPLAMAKKRTARSTAWKTPSMGAA